MTKATVIKIGGDVVDNAPLLESFLKNFAAIEGPKVLVHGGGKRATAMAKSLSIESKMINGRRITDADSLEVVTMVYGGLINKNLVAQLQALQVDSIGLSGADLNIIKAHKRQHASIDYGYVGDFEIDDIAADKFQMLLDNGITPIVCPLTHDGSGQLLNTNADTMASGIASALSKHYETELVYAFTKKGVLTDPNDDDSCISELNPESYEELKSAGAIVDGMIPKLKNAFDALENGLSKVLIKHALDINTKAGTTITL